MNYNHLYETVLNYIKKQNINITFDKRTFDASYEDLTMIYNYIKNNNINLSMCSSPCVLYICGLISNSNNDVKKFKKLLYDAAVMMDINSLIVLAMYYKEKNKLELYETYLLYAADRGSIDSIINLGIYYSYINERIMYRYFLRSINKDNTDILLYLYNYNIGKGFYDTAITFCAICADYNNIDGLVIMGKHYYKTKNIKRAKKYHTLAFINMDNKEDVYNIINFYKRVGNKKMARLYYEMMVNYY